MKKIVAALLVVLMFTLSACNIVTDNIVKHNVILHTNNEDGQKHTITVEDGSSIDTLNEYAIYDGYSFSGWYLDLSLTTPVDFTTITEDVELYAKWDEYFEYNVTLHYGDNTTTIVAPNGIVGEIETAEQYGHYFSGWYYEPTFETRFIRTTTLTGDVDLYSKYNQVDYYSYLSSTNPVVTVTVKDMGVMTLELFPSVSKNTVDNFIKYVEDGDYINSTFHRVISGFMIQGGIVLMPHCSIEGAFEANGVMNDLLHSRGVLSMARTSVMNSATSQFFIMHRTSPHLDGGYASFGGLSSGFNILDLIAEQPTNIMDAPLDQLIIENITVELNGYTPGDVVCAN